MTTKLFSGENVVYTTQESIALQPPTPTDINGSTTIALNNIDSEFFPFHESTTTDKSLGAETFIMKLAKKSTKTERSMTIKLPNPSPEQEQMESEKYSSQSILDTLDLNMICVLLGLFLVAIIVIAVCVMLMVI